VRWVEKTPNMGQFLVIRTLRGGVGESDQNHSNLQSSCKILRQSVNVSLRTKT